MGNAEVRVSSRMLADAAVHCRTPTWLRYGIIGTFVLAGIGLGYMALGSGALPDDAPGALRPVLLVAGLLLVALGLLPRLRRSNWTQFFASTEGLFLPGDALPEEHTSWLFVPWNNVLEIHVETLRGQRSGVLFELRLSEPQVERYLRAHQRRLAFARQPAPAERFPIGFSSPFLDAPRAARTMRELRAAATGGAPAADTPA